MNDLLKYELHNIYLVLNLLKYLYTQPWKREIIQDVVKGADLILFLFKTLLISGKKKFTGEIKRKQYSAYSVP